MPEETTLNLEQLEDAVLAALEGDETARLESLLAPLHPGDIAELIARIPLSELRIAVFRHVPDELAGDVLDLVPEVIQDELVEDLTPTELVEAVQEMSPDDAADLITDLEPAEQKELLENIPQEQSDAIRDLMRYPSDTAGGLMTPQFTALQAGTTAGQAIDILRRVADSDHEVFYYVYVVDARNKLLGALSLRDLLLARSHQLVDDCMITNVYSVDVMTDQEEVARTFKRYGYLALPVVDTENRLLGVVTVDDIIEVIQDEDSEDVQKMVGAGGDEGIDSALTLSIRRRLPWLKVNMVTAFLAAGVVSFFQDLIERNVVLAVFLPFCAMMAGNAGQQALAVVIRGVVLDTAASRRWFRILGRELCLGCVNGSIIGALTGLVVYFFSNPHNPVLAVLIGAALMATMMTASVSGAGIPLLMRRIGFDPAQGSTVILTTITDVVGFGFFLGLARLLEPWFASPAP
ncbi:MAG: magnesium transporter [Phycisphaerae bacterium]|nr:magnesium transporter [Phycisphaerae bacterium]